jgi:hypothetical protein
MRWGCRWWITSSWAGTGTSASGRGRGGADETIPLQLVIPPQCSVLRASWLAVAPWQFGWHVNDLVPIAMVYG